jgi:hypothetical protein
MSGETGLHASHETQSMRNLNILHAAKSESSTRSLAGGRTYRQPSQRISGREIQETSVVSLISLSHHFCLAAIASKLTAASAFVCDAASRSLLRTFVSPAVRLFVGHTFIIQLKLCF